MRVAMVAACPFPSHQGSQVFVRQMCEALSRRGHEVELLTYGQGDVGIATKGYVHHRIPRLPGDDALRSGPTWAKPLLDGRLAIELSRLLARRDFDVVHCHNYEAAAIGALVRIARRVPTVYHSHGLLEEELPSYFASASGQAGGRLAGRLFDRWVPRAVDHTVALSEADAARLRSRGLPKARSTVLPPAIDDPGASLDRASARGALGIENDRFVVGYAGNLDNYQSLEALATAIARLGASRGARPPLWLVVTHNADPRFDALLARSGARAWTRVVEVPSFAAGYRATAACDALVLPRQVPSGLPIKLLNYLAQGSVVVAASGGFGLVVDGEDGLVVEDAGPDGLATALARVASDESLAARLRQGARARFLRDLTWGTAIPALEAVYAEATEAARAAETARAMLR